MGGIARVPGRGRKKKPTARKKAAGNPGKRKLNEAEPNFGVVTNIDPPEWITGAARDMWLRVAPLLCSQKVIHATDIQNIEVYCIAYRNMRIADVDVQSNGAVVTGANGGPVKNPALTAFGEAVKQMTSYGALLGLDPISRSRLMGGGQTKPENAFSILMND
jgi:P27 family predicted phage terminase small subunit